VRIVRFHGPMGAAVYGLAERGTVTPLRNAPWETGGVPLPATEPVEARALALLTPCVPGKVLGIGRNYLAHARELGNEVPAEPLVFLKPPSALLPHEGTVLLPKEAGRVDYEGELALVIGRRARRVPKDGWRDVLFGLTVALDISARDLQKKDGQWWRAKGYDTFCPLGPSIETGVDPSDLLLETRVDGELRQSARTSDMIFDVGTVIAHVSAAMTLEPGDVILTGTPEGVGPLSPGQTVTVTIERVGTLSVKVAAE